jgi:predicted DNA-binding mobile mystery protein A
VRVERSIRRRKLDGRLLGLAAIVGPLPEQGWVRVIREALGMSMAELAGRMRVGPSRVGQIERAEPTGSVQVSTLCRAAEAMTCDLVYVLVPREPLDEMVWRQALERAAEVLGTVSPADFANQDPSLEDEARFEEVEALAYSLADRPGLWRGHDLFRRGPRPFQLEASAGPVPPAPPPASWRGGP